MDRPTRARPGTRNGLQDPIRGVRDPGVRGGEQTPSLAGARPPRKPKPALPPIRLETRTPSLSDRVIAVLRERFASYDHFPSEDHWKGLSAIAQAIEDMAEGRAEREYSYSSLATGMGKTSVLLEAIRQMRKDPAYAEVGIVVFCSRLDQIERMIAELDLPREEFAVETGQANTELNQRGRGRFNRNGKWVSEHQQAPILITTQAKLLTVVALRFSDEFESFWRFNNRPRQVRVWDEAVMPAKPLVLTPTQVLEFASRLDLLREPRAADELRALAAELQDSAEANGKTYEFPSLPWLWWIKEPEALQLSELDSPGNILFRMAGRLVRLFRDPSSSGGDGTTISYRELLPKDLAPMLILDASGDLRVTYKAWDLGRGGLTRLPSAGKTYRGLTINHWDRAAGKACYRNNADREGLADGAVKAFFSVPEGEEVFLIFRKQEKPYANLVEQIRRKIAAEGGNAERLKAITWGWHTASNEFANIKHAIVLGVLQYNNAANEAHWRAAAGTPAEADVDWIQVEELRLGEIAHHLFQGVGRGAVRKTINGDVPEGCTLWVVFSTVGNMAIKQRVLETCFPGATIRTWKPLGARLTGNKLKTPNRQRFFDALLRRLGEQGSVSFELSDLEASFSASMAFRFIKDPAIREALQERGVTVVGEIVKRGRMRRMLYTLRRGKQTTS